jgi:Cu-processing system permease protein
MKQIFYIAINTFRECVRDRIFYSLIAFAILLLLFSLVLSSLTIGEQTKIILDFGLAAIQLFGALIAVFVGINLIYKEIEKKTVYIILSTPISRAQFVLGKYAGLSLALVVEILIMTAGLIALAYYEGHTIPPNIYSAIVPILIEFELILASALFFSAITSPFISGLLTLCIFIIGHLTNDIKLVVETTNSEFLKYFTDIIYYVMPNLELLNYKGSVVHGMQIDFSSWTLSIIYGLGYSSILVSAAVILFNRKDVK